jgi:hypothetical protein
MAGCSYSCSVQCFPCRTVCRWRCTWGKRSITDDEPQNRLPFPDKFQNYDLDTSGKITLEELAKAISVDEHSKETLKAFKLADQNGDGGINCKEFEKAPYLFEHKPTCPTT